MSKSCGNCLSVQGLHACSKRLTLSLCPAGATLVQLYTALAYEGPSIVPKMKQQLAACLEADGFTSVQEAVGVDHLIPQS